jgi:hypothetical protein
MDKVSISDAKYQNDSFGNLDNIVVTIDGVIMSVPLDPLNRHYVEILHRVESGELTIQEAD